MADSYVGYAPADRVSLPLAAVSVGNLNTTGTASSSTYLRGDMAWSTNPLGDVTGPGSSTDDALAKFDSTTGKIIQNSTATLTDAGLLTVSNLVGTINTVTQNTITTMTGLTTVGTIASLVATTADINAGTFDGIVGGTTPAAGTFTTLSGTTSITGTLATAAQANITSLGTIASLVATTADINAGTFDGIVGGTTPAAGTFTAFTSTGIDDNSNAMAMTITSAEEIGIGTVSPGKQLHITKSAVADLVALTDGATIAVDFDTGQNFTVTLAGNRALGNPTNVTAGQTGSIFVTQDGTGSRTLSYGTSWEFPAATAPTLTTTAAAVDRIDYIVKSSTSIQAVATLAYA